MVAAPSRLFHWPGGISLKIQIDPRGDIDPKEADNEAKGWMLFVEEQWVSRAMANVPDEDGDYEVNDDRSLRNGRKQPISSVMY
ncbi:hypothetical protein AnigIFM60653_007673 [Aspergillus niger]|nr:hypothetical protein AnigIFM50267_007125 [Aspergillus niger]GLA06728.1 hypothetical protein AnigIFM60653_007673 [Aspergillus niger]GLA12656.1 hypothetical protein AnigIFM62618_008606 [Aspergillus niger]